MAVGLLRGAIFGHLRAVAAEIKNAFVVFARVIKKPVQALLNGFLCSPLIQAKADFPGLVAAFLQDALIV
jgi:hypothetical protein